MNITLDDGRTELWQWDTGRKIVVDDKSVSEVHFSKYSSNQAITREVINGKAEIPNFLLQDTHAVTVYAYSGSVENGYTVAEKTFNVAKKPKPANYVETEEDKVILAKLKEEIGDLSELQTEAKNNLVSAINEAAASGGSTDAVLYTAQTLTDEQKKQARKNIGAAASDFVVNATLNSDSTVTLDKTFAQIQAAIQEGKKPVVNLSASGTDDNFMPLVSADTSYVVFAAVADVSEGTISNIGVLITADDDILFDHSASPALNSDGALIQFPMESDPVSPMQIATKKYVDGSIEAAASGGADKPEDAVELLAVSGIVQPVSDTNGKLYVDGNGKLFVI